MYWTPLVLSRFQFPWVCTVLDYHLFIVRVCQGSTNSTVTMPMLWKTLESGESERKTPRIAKCTKRDNISKLQVIT